MAAVFVIYFEIAFAYATGSCDAQIAPRADSVTRSKLEEEAAVEAAGRLVIDIFDAGVVAQARGSGAVLETLLTAHREVLVEKQSEPLGMVELPSLKMSFEILQAFGHARQAECFEQIENAHILRRRVRNWLDRFDDTPSLPLRTSMLGLPLQSS